MQRHLRLDHIDPSNPESFNSNPYPEGFGKVAVPEGESGIWAVQKFEVEPERVAMNNLRAIRDGNPQRVVPPGEYTRLIRKDEGWRKQIVVMSDTPAEAWDHEYALRAARDHVLVNGLGLGFYLAALLRKEHVARVTVIEKSEDVIRLVAPVFAGEDRVEIINADAYEFQPPKNVLYGFAWHDIWDNICEDNNPDMTRLRRKYGRRAVHQGCWGEEYL